MTRSIHAFVVLFVLSSACGREATEPASQGTTVAAAPAPAARPTPSQLSAVEDARCEVDPSPLAVTEGDSAHETVREGNDTVHRFSRRNGSTTVGVICRRGGTGGERTSDMAASDATLGGTPVTLLIDSVSCDAVCDEAQIEDEPGLERCDWTVTFVWVLDRDLHLVGALMDEQGGQARVDGDVLLIGSHRRTLQGGALVAAR
jgi:hypothetical protein